MGKLLGYLPRIAKAIVGAVVGGAIATPAAQQVLTDTPVIWSWEHFLASSLGIGIAVYLIPNKEKGNRNVIR